ncbi:SprB repeat-containing protein [Cesiribacter sp. SM1]|uniref:SprB repeat-containing protein n=1 Tax=Cesiribacter sp. SM1 TaxID=2861196 RepID=UPI001CD4A92D|nr:SprB repeat-containing protein [Cesiribacter sp. SM1]
MKSFFTFFSPGAIVLFLLGCSGDPEPEPCQTPPAIVNVAIVNASCGNDNGSLQVQASGGSGALSYSLNNGSFQQSSQFSNLAAGTYTLKVRDEQGCTTEQQSAIAESSSLLASIQSSTNAGCGTSNGGVAISGTGGQGSYTYSLDGSVFQESASFSNLAAGQHTAYVKDAAGCVSSTDFSLLRGTSFDGTVKSIIEANCAVAGCHVSGTGRANFTQFSQIQNNAAAIKEKTHSKIMPPPASGKSLSAAEIAAIACWVDDGALQN